MVVVPKQSIDDITKNIAPGNNQKNTRVWAYNADDNVYYQVPPKQPRTLHELIKQLKQLQERGSEC